MRKSSIAASAGAVLLLLSHASLANPIMVINDVYVEQFPGTSHVQVTRTYSSYPGISTTVTRDGTTVAVAFETSSAGSRDLGSGMSELSTQVGCDCFVPIGHHTYVFASHTTEIDMVQPSAAVRAARSPSAQCDTKCASASGGGGGAAGGPSSTAAGATAISSGGTAGRATVSATSASTSTGGASLAQTTTASTSTGGTSVAQTAAAGGANDGLVARGGSVANTTNAVVADGGSIASGGSRVNTTMAKGGSTTTGGSAVHANSSAAPTQSGDSDSSGCAISRTADGLVPLGLLAALGLLVMRRRK